MSERWEDSHLLVRAAIIGAATLAPALGFLWLASSLGESPAWATFWSNIGTTVLSVGLIGILYDALLKGALVRDIRRSIDSGALIQSSGIVRITFDVDASHLKELFATANSLDVVPSSPLTWHDQNISWLTQLARERKIRCRIFLPEPGSYAKTLSGSGTIEPVTANHCSVKFAEYTTSWATANASEVGSTLEVLIYEGYPHGEFLLGDAVAAVFVGDILGKKPALRKMAYLYRGKAAKPTIDWLSGEVRSLNGAPVAGSAPDTRTPAEILPDRAAGPEKDATPGPQGEENGR